jgi:hypothetical protein
MIDKELLSEVGQELQELEERRVKEESKSSGDKEGASRSKCGCSGDVGKN